MKATSKPFKLASSTSSSAVASSAPRSRFRSLSSEELAVKRANDECYHCTEKFTADHKYTSKGVFLLEIDNDSELDTAADELGISLHALTGIDIANTMKLQVRIKGTTLVMLVDIGSTHTFIKEGLLPQLGLLVTPREGLTVKVANGERVTSGGVCCATDMDISSEHFSTYFYVLPLDGFNIILGIQWLRTLGPILWDFDNLTMCFWHDGRRVLWTGVGSMALHCNTLSTPRDLMEALWDSFTDIFTEPSGLPPSQHHDHCICLLPGTAPVAVWPYCYPQLLKDEIEHQCDEMLRQGIIQECTLAFSSLVLLVKKTDDTCRFCIDYHELNQ
jgi:hypothetical protein